VQQVVSWDKLIAVLDGWIGGPVAIRVLTEGNLLLAVFHGVLRARAEEKPPAVFWPLVHADPSDRADHLEQPGIYVHPDALETAKVHVGGTVVEIHLRRVTLNLRRL
jgi:hypothetical protein